jgi:thymidylate kinase
MKHRGCIQHPIIVVDGPDATGKSTLVSKLEEYGFKSMHLTYRWPQKMDLYHWAAMNWAIKEAKRRPVVLDRWWPSEEVYAGAYRGGSKNIDFNRGLDRVAVRFGFTYVIALPMDKAGYLHFFDEIKNKREEMYDNMSRVYDGYAQMVSQGALDAFSRRDVRRYDFTRHMEPSSFKKYTQELIKEATFRVYNRNAVAHETSFNSFSGNVQNPSGIVFINHKGRKGHTVYAGAGHSGTETASDLMLDSHRWLWVNLNGITDHEWLAVARIANENRLNPHEDVVRHDLPPTDQMTVISRLKHFMNLKEMFA